MAKVLEETFTESVRKGKIKAPNSNRFTAEKWNKEWGKFEADASERDQKVYKAGIIIDSLLGEVRGKLAELYSKAPKTTYEKLMLSYVASSNRTLAVAIKNTIKEVEANVQDANAKGANVHAAMIEANMMGDKKSLGELAHGAVDGFQLAVRVCLGKVEKGEKLTVSENPIDEMSFVMQESGLSQLYSGYLHLWQCVLWSDYDLIELDDEHKVFSIQQPKSEIEVSFLSSSNRKDRLSGQNTMLASRPMIRSKFLGDKFVMMKRENKRRVAYVANVKDAGDKLITFNAEWRIRELDLQSHYPEKWLTGDYGKGFSLNESLNVFRCMMLMANTLKHKFPEDDSAFTINKLKEFCPTVRIFSLKRALCEATGLAAEKIDKILEFMTIKASPTSDLWCQPLIKTSKNEYAIVVSALCSPSMFRVFERWVDDLGIDLGEKGYTYEDTVLEELNDSLEKNTLITDYDKGVSKRIRLDAGEEEFDLLARIDDLVIIGEAKSIVTTDSEISKARAAGILEHAGQQVTRKTEFLKANLQAIFERLGWNYDPSVDYKFAQCILNSGRVFVGYEFDGVPVIDEKILRAYFASDKVNLFSFPSRQGGTKTIAWLQLYSNLDELKSNFQIYACNPPQLNEDADCFEYNVNKFPYMTEDSYKVIKNYLVLKQRSPIEMLEREHHFPVVKSDDFDAEFASVDVVM
ncbi:hypothetical protein F0H41_05830 [Vibrio cholerae]|uniref:hypothetical protein n=1 Tax=Vibrio cholerae TaxID=666 RepID=UPI00115B4FB4|nr:hypothetical protein [Vibrio cholerae]KAA1002126.1 hypothetical protein F0H41_05830 [Vibrio cholerae]KAA1010184.1 hypothetical protein F0H40_01875 [Vibrio cholerae]KAA1018754.1 hypothetical protein F0H43_01875 [Vibrio cholerae]KAA1022813.1 hypothetical protein F0H42_05625 [Vibrio cholerae]KAA1026757.1 hypothetical protein F0H44_06945 [Vibrio cholerae]